MMKKIFLYSLIFILCSCNKDDSDSQNNGNNYIPVSASVIGTVHQNGDPIQGVTVSMNNSTQTTDQFGIFRYAAQDLNSNGQLITVSHPGFYEVSKIFNPSANATSTLSISLMARQLNTTFDSSNGVNSATNGGGSISIPPNAIVDESGAAYSGQVNMYARWMDPTDLRTLEQMPGDLRATNEAGEQGQLITYGMLVVELDAPSGDKLNLGTGAEAELSFPVPASLLSDAPADISLWSYDTESGNWMEEGMASLVGNSYVGSVSHFSYWNCDAFNQTVDLSLSVLFPDRSPLDKGRLTLKLNDGFTGSAITNSMGMANGQVPINEEIQVEIFIDGCPSSLYTTTIGPFTSDSKEELVIVPSPSYREIVIQGNFIDCDENPLTNGIVFINYVPYNLDANGSINTTIYTCDPQLRISGFDYESMTASSGILYSSESISFSNEATCDEVSLSSVWRMTSFTIDGFDGIDFYQVDDYFYEFFDSGDMIYLGVAQQETNKSLNMGTYVISSNGTEIMLTNNNTGDSDTAGLIQTANTMTLTFDYGEIWIQNFEKVTTDLCAGVNCSAGSECNYGYCVP